MTAHGAIPHDSWIIIVWLNNWPATLAAVSDALVQTVVGRPRVLLIGSNLTPADRASAETLAASTADVLCWFHSPALPSLSFTWNTALRFVWEIGGTAALVLNNDLRLHADTYARLRGELRASKALFVSGVGVTEAQFNGAEPTQNQSKGGPDFSCFVISRECHELFPFDEAFIPAYCEDVDLHRRVMLAGAGRYMYSIDVPYWHVDHGSGTLKATSPEARVLLEQAITQGSRAHYAQKWGGPVNAELYGTPFGPDDIPGPSTPDLFAAVRAQWDQ